MFQKVFDDYDRNHDGTISADVSHKGSSINDVTGGIKGFVTIVLKS
jgi:hypothetical protein